MSSAFLPFWPSRSGGSRSAKFSARRIRFPALGQQCQGRGLSTEFLLPLLAIVLGGIVQGSVGIGFSIVAAPVLMVQFGTAVAVPLLLTLNTTVSIAAVRPQLWREEAALIVPATIACFAGMGAGILVYPAFSERTVLLLTALFLMLGLISSLITIRPGAGTWVSRISAFGAGLGTVWASTPGPLIILGFLAAGRTGQDARKIIQNVSVLGFGAAVALHLVSGPRTFLDTPHLAAFIAAAAVGALAGRWIGAKLPQAVLIGIIRVISVAAIIILVRRALLLD